MKTRTIIILATALLLAVGTTAAQAPPEGAGTYRGEAFDKLFESLTLRVTFDRGSMQPDMAAGEKSKPRIFGSYDKKQKQPAFEDGLVGKALVLGSGAAIYPRKGNVPLDTQGAMAFWVKPLEFKHDNDSNVVFVKTTESAFYIQRQGPMVKDGRTLRAETVHYLAKASKDQKIYTNISVGPFKNDRWYFIVANWKWPRMEMSIDGGPFKSRALPQDLAEGLFQGLIVGARGGPKALMDEFMVFDRPLAMDDVRLLYGIKNKQPGNDTPAEKE